LAHGLLNEDWHWIIQTVWC